MICWEANSRSTTIATSRSTAGKRGSDSVTILARSILKQFLQVKFKQQHRRHLKLVRQIRMQFTQITQRSVAHLQIRRFSGVQKR